MRIALNVMPIPALCGPPRAVLRQGMVILALIYGLANAACGNAWADTEVEQIDQLLQAWNRDDAPGLAVAVIKDDTVIYRRGFGQASLEHGTPLGTDSVFYIASVSKQFAAAAVLLAVQEGKLSLDESVRLYVDALPDYAQPITISHLLHHTSGLRDYLWLMAWSGMPLENVYSEADLVELIARQKSLNFSPGEDYSYSNSNYFLLSQVIKKATGSSLREYAEEKIFKPLGMTHTHFHDDPREVVTKRAMAYARGVDGRFRLDWIPHWDKVGDGNLLTSVDDLVLWQANFDKPRVGGQPFVEQMVSTATLNEGERLRYAAGLVVDEYRGLLTVGHSGAFNGFRTNITRYPVQRVSIICLANRGDIDADTISRQIAEIVLAGEMNPVPTTLDNLPEESLTARTGLYRDPVTHTFLVLSMKGPALQLQHGIRRRDLTPIGLDDFIDANLRNPFRLHFAAQTKAERPNVEVELGGRVRVYEPIVASQPSPTELKAYEGLFYSDELRAECEVTFTGEQLSLRRKQGTGVNLLPADHDRFYGPDLSIEFLRTNEQIDGLTLFTSQTRGVTFVRR